MSKYIKLVTAFISQEKSNLLEKWIKEQDKKVMEQQKRKYPYYGCCGGGYTCHITNTSLGQVVKVSNNITGEEINVTDYKDW